MKNIILLDNHVMVRNGICSFLQSSMNCKIIASEDTAEKIFKSLKEHFNFNEVESCAIVDMKLKIGDGLQFIAEAKKLYPKMKFIMYSMYSTVGHIENAKKAGADGYIAKDSAEKDLIVAINKVFAGEKYFPSELESDKNKGQNTFGMTKKERFVLSKILENKSNTEIAEEMKLKIGTIQNYTSRIYDKTNCKNRSQLLKEFAGKI